MLSAVVLKEEEEEEKGALSKFLWRFSPRFFVEKVALSFSAKVSDVFVILKRRRRLRSIVVDVGGRDRQFFLILLPIC